MASGSDGTGSGLETWFEEARNTIIEWLAEPQVIIICGALLKTNSNIWLESWTTEKFKLKPFKIGERVKKVLSRVFFVYLIKMPWKKVRIAEWVVC